MRMEEARRECSVLRDDEDEARRECSVLRDDEDGGGKEGMLSVER